MNSVVASRESEARGAVIAGFVCNLLWGATPVLFITLGRLGASSWEIVGERALWSAPWAALLVWLAGQQAEARAVFAEPRKLALLAFSAISIGTGWSVYVWAVNSGRTIEASLGYYITPLLNMAVGGLFFRERIGRLGAAAVALAVAGVVLQTLALGRLPIIALVLATTFWIYGLIRRHVVVSAQAGLLVETTLMAAPGLTFVAWLWFTGHGAFGRALPVSLLMPLVGPATVVPLAIFAWTARRLPFSTLGFLQFISPTVSFVIGLAVGEKLNRLGVASFLFIWAGAILFAVGGWRAGRRLES